MNTVKSVIFIACIIGVITSMTDIATPEGTLKKQLRSVLAVILFACGHNACNGTWLQKSPKRLYRACRSA